MFISSGFIIELDTYGEPDLTFNFLSLLGGIIPAFSVIIGGWVFRLIMNSLSIIVESAYRNLKPAKVPNVTE